MEHAFQLVDMLDESGRIIGSKLRHQVDKTKDIYHAVYAWLITPARQVALSHIPAREDLPNLYASQYGLPMATIRRSGETAEQALRRGALRELFMNDITPHSLGEQMFTLEDGRQVFASAFYLHSEAPAIYSAVDVGSLSMFSRAEFETILQAQPERTAPTLRALWQAYQSQLPL